MGMDDLVEAGSLPEDSNTPDPMAIESDSLDTESNRHATLDADVPTNSSRTTKSATIATVVLLLLIVMVINWPYQYVAVTSATSGDVDSTVDFPQVPRELPVMGGWPFRFLISYSNPATGNSTVRRFSAVALSYNLGISTLVVACLVCFVHRRNRRVAMGKIAKRKVTIADLLVFTLLLAAPFAWWQRIDARQMQEVELSQRILRDGGKHRMAAWIPAVIASQLPIRVIDKLRRIRAVRIEYPKEDLVAQLVALRDMTTLRMGGGEYDLRLLDRLAANPHLHDLRISGRVMDGRTIQWIASNKRLDTLNLMRTNVSAEALQSLGELPNLKRLNLIHSDVELSDLGTPGFSQTIRELVLPHPQPGDAASLDIEGWPLLEKLTINELESQTNSIAMKVRLADLPSLKTLELDVFQKFDLTLHNLPQLAAIDDLDYEWRTRIPRGGAAPGSIWCSRFDAQGLPAFERLEVFGVDMAHFRARDMPKFNYMGVGVFFRTVSAETFARELTPEVAASMIAGIGASDGPTTLDLDAVPLAGVDFSPLSANRGLERIMLSQSGTTLKQWKSLAAMKWLKRLDIKACPIDSEGIAWVLDTFPELEHFAFAPSPESMFASRQAHSLEIVNRENLRTLDFGDFPMEFFSTVRVVHSPNLSIPLKFGYVGQLEIDDAPAVTGIAISGPLPEKIKLGGLRDLRFFAVGGPGVTDELIQSITRCKELRTLTLAYPEVTVDGLGQLGSLANLSSLNLPGSAINDAVIEGWPVMSGLSNLDLRDTDVTGAGIQRLLEGNKMVRLVLNNTKIDKADLTTLGQHEGLSELLLAGVGIDAKTLEMVLNNGVLKRLDLSDSEIAPEVYDVLLANAEVLEHLILQNCDVDSSKIARIGIRYQKLRFDLNGSTVETKLMSQLISAQRIVDAEEWDEMQSMQAMMMAMQSGRTAVAPEHPAIIDVQYFADLSQQIGQAPFTTNTPTTAPVPLGVQLGDWLGRAVGGPPQPAEATSDDADDSDSKDSADDYLQELLGEADNDILELEAEPKP